ncbi:MAG TPA: methyltransferase domain-containing protein [Planctomycetaceae bacterium]|nr:methyltransferase domain-containing protein [Planctomycetaceae bacterium]
MKIAALILIFVVAFVLVSIAWRIASQHWSLPCPTILAWSLENPLAQKINRTAVTLDRIGLKPGQRVLEFGPGPGRLLIPAAQRVLPGGEAVGVELQPGMVERLKRNAARKSVLNLNVLQGDASAPLVEEGVFDLVILSCALGEIPDRAGVIRQSFRALRPGGRLSVSEMFGDPHYQSKSTVERLARDAGFETEEVLGGRFMFTANFRKPVPPA